MFNKKMLTKEMMINSFRIIPFQYIASILSPEEYKVFCEDYEERFMEKWKDYTDLSELRSMLIYQLLNDVDEKRRMKMQMESIPKHWWEE